MTIPSLAAWTAIEWVVGGGGTDWGDYAEAAPTIINFGPQAATLSPRTTTYAYMRFAAAPESVAGTVELQDETDVAANALAPALQCGGDSSTKPPTALRQASPHRPTSSSRGLSPDRRR